MIIPPNQLSADALNGLIESFVHREGTDYGAYEVSLEDKVAQVKRHLLSDEVLIVFDAASESVNMMTRQQYSEWISS